MTVKQIQMVLQTSVWLRPTMSNMCWHALEHSLLEKTRLLLKETEKNKTLCGQSDSLVLTQLPTVALRLPLASLSIQESIFYGTYDNQFCLCLLVFA